MIVVNSPGDWGCIFSELRHAEPTDTVWTLADLVFPNFLFLVGASSVFSIHAGRFKGTARRTLSLRLLNRGARLFVLQLCLTVLPSRRFAWPDLRNLRVYGVLTRTALCSIAVGGLCLLTSSIPLLAGIAATLLVGYWALLRYIPIPGHGLPSREIPLPHPEHNLAAYLDRHFVRLLQRHLRTGSLYHGTHDPEGLLSTIPAIATCLIGAIAALWLRSHSASPVRKRNRLIVAGLLLAVAGRLSSRRVPASKSLWTSSYVLLSGGLSLLVLAALYQAADIKRLHKRSHLLRLLDWPWIVFGSNAITAYAVAGVLERSLTFALPGRPQSLGADLYRNVFARSRSSRTRSFAYAVAFTAACFLPNLLLWRKRIFVKI